MHETERNRLLNEVRRFRLAQADMRQVLAAVEALDGERQNGYLCRALETAIVVCYARPFGEKNAVGAIGEAWEPLEHFPKLHGELLRLRDQVYAHTDKTGAREVVDVGAMLDLDTPTYTKGWHPIARESLPHIAALASALERELERAARERSRRLMPGR